MGLNRLASLSCENIELLLALEKTEILVRAGQRFNLSASTATRTLEKIRQCMGDPLFNCVGGKMVPTSFFREIRPYLESIVELAHKVDDLSFSVASCQKTFRLTCCMAEISHVLAGIVPMMLHDAPESRLELVNYENEFAAVLDGLVDFAFVTNVNLPPDVHVMKCYPVDRVLLLRKDHPLTRIQRPLHTADLMMYKRVTIRTGRTRSWTSPDQNMFPGEKYLEHTAFITNRFFTAWGAMANSDLISVCGWRAAEEAMRCYPLTTLALPLDAKDDNPWNVLIWADSHHRDISNIWLRTLFQKWSVQEAQRVKALISAAKGPPGQYLQSS